MSRPLEPLEPGKCEAVVDDWDRPAYQASMQRITQPGDKRCPRKHTEQVGHLHLCTVHARLAREGFVDRGGRVADRNTMRDYRNYPKKFGRLYDWVSG